VPERPFNLSPLLDPPAGFPYFAAIITTTLSTICLWFSANGEQILSTGARGPFRLAGLILGALQGPAILLAVPMVAAILTPGLGAVLPAQWRAVLRGARWGGIVSLVLSGWPVLPAVLGSLLFLLWSPETVFATLVIAPGGALRLMIPGIPLGALAARIWTQRRAG